MDIRFNRKSADARQSRSLAMAVGFLATMLSAPGAASISMPNEPLTTGARVAPNVLFILDDSGSMSFTEMYNPVVSSVSSVSGIRARSYATNTIYYNPAVTYRPWVTAGGALMTGGTGYDGVYGDFNNAGGNTINLSSSSSCRSFNQNDNATSGEMSGGTQVCGGTQTYYVPKNPAMTSQAYLSDGRNYWRYQIHTDGRVVRSEYGPRTGSAPDFNRGLDNRDCSSGSGTGNAWRNCTFATAAPGVTGRSEEAERNNYAIWFSYHRTRMKAAKAGASEAFSDLSDDVRVGFRTIWRRNGSQTNGNWPTQSNPIPVNYNNGLFSDVTIGGVLYNNRSRWYSRLQSSIGYNGTPLHGALQAAGDYFSGDSASGAYGPESTEEQLSCRQNFAILTTDGYWNDYSNYSNVGNVDNTAGSQITSPSGQSYQYSPSAPYKDGHGGASGTLADVAMRYWNRDLRSDLRNIVPTTAANPAFWQHMVTFGISIGLQGSTGMRSVGDVPSNYASWPDPTDGEDADRIDDLLHAAVNSRGTFLSASNPEEFQEGLKGALAAIVERTGSFSNVAANSSTLNAETQLFQANYVSGVWTGDILSFARNAAGTAFETTPEWKASEQIPTVNRRVFTKAGAFPASATAGQLSALRRTAAGDYPVTGENNAAYLTGARELELRNGGNLRNRNHLLGDIVNSSPAYVADTKTLYVGANDGMLHAIDSEDGKEAFAFIPDGIHWGNFGSLSRPDYGHRYFVDGPVVVSSRTQTPGENILVGSLGRGGKGIFALDVTTPASFNASSFKWEKYETPGNNMGLVLGKPIIGRLNNGETGLIVPNGINSTTGRAVLLVYNLRTGVLLREIDTLVGSPAANNPDSNGLMAPVGLDQDANGTLDVVYAGDMLGNVWKFDLSASLPAGWGVAFSGDPLFTARGPSGERQPIMGGVAVGIHPTSYRPWVFFGTGRFMTVSDPSNQDVQGLYGIADFGTPITNKASQLTRRRVIVATTADGRRIRGFQANDALPPGSRGWYVDLLEPPAPGTPIGERIVTAPQMSGSALVVSSIIPLSDACESDGRGYINALDAFTGTSTSSPFFDTDGDGDFTDEMVEAVDEDGNTILVPIGSVDPGLGMVTQPTLFGGGGGGGGGGNGEACASGSTGEAGCIDIDDLRNTGRVSWREVLGR
ncbi:PilC/PilY family type IV pilus protein [Luteimonas sp. MC1895]|uniref:pilus assembly protein n=1 Tax=Luteimonas sp. MC1895 TaxID=2819513 RepID=UPI0018F0CABA|nr:PilC/PilY family type IV pilus protein [Luteimonas sp. MC1895]MBJ6978788.1 pilus assembly protein [Luteimonas sp. MC1895]